MAKNSFLNVSVHKESIVEYGDKDVLIMYDGIVHETLTHSQLRLRLFTSKVATTVTCVNLKF